MQNVASVVAGSNTADAAAAAAGVAPNMEPNSSREARAPQHISEESNRELPAPRQCPPPLKGPKKLPAWGALQENAPSQVEQTCNTYYRIMLKSKELSCLEACAATACSLKVVHCDIG